MAEYIEREALIRETEKKIAEANSYRMAVVDREFIDIINGEEAADVVPKREIANVLCDLKIAVHNKAHYNHAQEVPTDITIRELDAILQGFVEKWRVK